MVGRHVSWFPVVTPFHQPVRADPCRPLTRSRRKSDPLSIGIVLRRASLVLVVAGIAACGSNKSNAPPSSVDAAGRTGGGAAEAGPGGAAEAGPDGAGGGGRGPRRCLRRRLRRAVGSGPAHRARRAARLRAPYGRNSGVLGNALYGRSGRRIHQRTASPIWTPIWTRTAPCRPSTEASPAGGTTRAASCRRFRPGSSCRLRWASTRAARYPSAGASSAGGAALRRRVCRTMTATSDLPQGYVWGGRNYPTPTELWGAISPGHYNVQHAYTIARVPCADMTQRDRTVLSPSVMARLAWIGWLPNSTSSRTLYPKELSMPPSPSVFAAVGLPPRGGLQWLSSVSFDVEFARSRSPSWPRSCSAARCPAPAAACRPTGAHCSSGSVPALPFLWPLRLLGDGCLAAEEVVAGGERHPQPRHPPKARRAGAGGAVRRALGALDRAGICAEEGIRAETTRVGRDATKACLPQRSTSWPRTASGARAASILALHERAAQMALSVPPISR